MAKIVQATPDRWLSRGESAVTVGRSIPLTVWGGIVGERANIKIVHRGQNQERGMVVDVDTPSPHRMQVPCEKYDACGGCPFMHIDPSGQRAARVALVREALDEAGLDVPIEGWTPSPDGMFDFRHVVKLGVGWSTNKERVKIGSFGRRDRRITPIPHCDVAAPVLRRVMTSLAHHMLELGLEPYDPESDTGVMRAAVIRASRTTGEVMLTLIVGRRPKKLDDLAELVASDNGEVVGVWLHVNMDHGNALFSADEDGEIGMRALSGKDWIEEDLDGISVRLGPGDFYQTNPSMALPLYRRVLERLNPGPDEAFVDLYCGVGGMTLLAGRTCGHAIGVEAGAGAVRRAKESARRNRISAEFVCGPVERELPKIAERLAHPVIAVDPARRGLEPAVIDALIAIQPRRLAYISCSPRSMARDLALFQQAGASIESVELFDMFPHTAHVECLTLLSFPVEATRAPRRKLIRGATG
jgi:23S rRNA (uracil1939-C5)-methyltransferase